MPNEDSDRRFYRAVLWQNVERQGTDYCALWETREGWLLQGTAVVAHDDQHPVLASYEIFCNFEWRTHRVDVQCSAGGDAARLSLLVEGGGTWRDKGRILPAVEGCVDVDLALTPATNTLPIRRLHLDVNQSAEVTAAWIRFPGLDVQSLPQRYTRLGTRLYKYESASGFVAEIEVDDLGLVENYKGGWERIAVHSKKS